MKKLIIVPFLFLVISLYSQNNGNPPPSTTNEFKIGMFGHQWMEENNLPVTTPIHNGFKSSHLNVLAEDGFNITQQYMPDWWVSQSWMDNFIKLSSANGMKLMIQSRLFYWKNNPNQYNSTNFARPNYDALFNNIYSATGNNPTIWGYQITEEAAYHHPFNDQNVPGCYTGNPPPCTNTFVPQEIPPGNVSDAILHFRTQKNLNSATAHQKLVVMEAAHGTVIGDNAPYDSFGHSGGNHIPGDYLKISNKPDVFFDGSYISFDHGYQLRDNMNNVDTNQIPLCGYHYLGFLKSIDFAHKYVSDVHKVVSIAGNEKSAATNTFCDVFHLDQSIPNANSLWFQTYASIIHGAKGIWFWMLPEAWNMKINEKPAGWESMPDRFNRENFPASYRFFTSNLAKELRYLVNANLLSTDLNSIVCSKTDGVDHYKVLPINKSYLPVNQRSMIYDLRYTFRTNGNEVIAIITNPLPFALENITLDFSHIPNEKVRNANSANVLFATGQWSQANASTYKTARNSGINLANGTINDQFQLNINSCNKQVNLNFGPFDVIILKFNNTVSSPVWHENATAGYLSSSNSDVAVEVNGTNRRAYYVRGDGVVCNTYNTPNSWLNSEFSLLPKSKLDSKLIWNDSNKELFYVALNNTIGRIYWNGTNWNHEYTLGTGADSRGLALDQYNQVYYIGTDGYLRGTYNYGGGWGSAFYGSFPKGSVGSSPVWNHNNNELFYVAENNTVCRMYWTGNNWQYEYTAGYSSSPNSSVEYGQGFIFYVGNDNIIRSTYKSGGSWYNAWFPSAPLAKSNTTLKWNDAGTELLYIGQDDKIYSLYWSGSWNHKVISNSCDYLAFDRLNHVSNRIYYVGKDNIVREYNYSALSKSTLANPPIIMPESFDIMSESINVFPNPSSGQLIITSISNDKDLFDNANFVLYNNLGQIVYSSTLIKGGEVLNLPTELKSGIYHYKIENSNVRLKTGKLVIQK